jgi:hypothetical protein
VIEQLYDVRGDGNVWEVETYIIDMPARGTRGVIWISIERVHAGAPFIGVDVHEVGRLDLLA